MCAPPWSLTCVRCMTRGSSKHVGLSGAKSEWAGFALRYLPKSVLRVPSITAEFTDLGSTPHTVSD